MAQSPLEKLIEEEAESRAERDRFEELADQYRQQSHLPPGGDQSWREREAMRRSAYDKGYAPPPGDSSWREREAAALAENREPVEEFAREPVQEPLREEIVADAMAGEPYQPPEPVLEPLHVAKGGQGGIVFLFFLMAAIALAIMGLAYPEMLTAAYWRTPRAQTAIPGPPPSAQPQAAPAVEPPMAQPPAVQPGIPPAPPSSSAPDVNAPPPANEAATPQLHAAPPAEETPPPAPTEEAPPPSLPAAKPAPAAKTGSRASVPDDRDRRGFYAKVPGPNGAMEYQFFPFDPKMNPRTPAPKTPAVPDTGGFYAKAPRPDGTMQYRYFPSKPPPR